MVNIHCCNSEQGYCWLISAAYGVVQVGRPTNMPQCLSVIDRLKRESSRYCRIYVSSIHLDLNDNDLRTYAHVFNVYIIFDVYS